MLASARPNTAPLLSPSLTRNPLNVTFRTCHRVVSINLEDLDDSKKDSLLLDACKSGDAKRVHQCLEAGALADARDEDGDSALQIAAYSNRHEVVQLLLDARASIAYEPSLGVYRSPLYYAVTLHSPQICKSLLLAKASYFVEPEKPITRCMSKPEAVECLVSRASTPKRGTKPDCLALLLQAKAAPESGVGSSSSPILYAAMSGRSDVVKILLDAGARIDSGASMVLGGSKKRHSVFESVARLIAAFSHENMVMCEQQEQLSGRVASLKHILDSDKRLRSEHDPSVRAEAMNEYVGILTEMAAGGCHLVVEVLLAGGIDPNAYAQTQGGACAPPLLQ